MSPFPIGKEQLVQYAQNHGANKQLITILNTLPDVTFTSVQDLREKLSTLKIFGNMSQLFKS